METINEIEIPLNIDLLFKITNDVKNWPKLFDSYSKVEILKKEKNYIKFKLYFREKDNSIISWVSERRWKDNEKNKNVIAKRLFPLYPFEYTNIFWDYQYIDENNTRMIWKQDFEISKEMPKEKKAQFIDHLKKSPKMEMELIKKNVITMYQNGEF